MKVEWFPSLVDVECALEHQSKAQSPVTVCHQVATVLENQKSAVTTDHLDLYSPCPVLSSPCLDVMRSKVAQGSLLEVFIVGWFEQDVRYQPDTQLSWARLC